MSLTTIPRTVVRTYFDGLRIPVSTLARISGQADNSAWPPALVFEEFESSALQFVGGILRDGELVEQGRLQAAKVSELRRAAALELKATAKRAEAEAKLQRERAAAAGQQERALRQERDREAAVERGVRQQQARVTQQVDEAEAEIDDVNELRDRNVAAADRQARLVKLDAEAKALAKQQAAVASAERVDTLDKRLDQTKAQRKRS